MKMRLMALAVAGMAGTAMAQPANDQCSNAEAISGFGTFAYNSFGADTDGPETSCASGQAYSDVWFSWTATESGNVKVEICGSGAGFDSVLVAYEGGCGGAEIACNDDTCGLLSSVNFAVSAGETYTIRAGGYGEFDSGDSAITVAPYIPGVVVGPIVSPINGHTYYLMEPSSWTEGEATAVSMGGHLATVRSDEENQWIFDTVMNPGGGIRRGWIGLNDFAVFGEYVWTSGEPVTYTNWGGGEPNHANGTEFYAQIPWYSTQWNDNSDFPGDDPCYPIVEIIGDQGCAADFNDDDFLDFFDYDDYVNCFETSNCPPGKTADFNGDDFVDFFDYDDFVSLFETGC